MKKKILSVLFITITFFLANSCFESKEKQIIFNPQEEEIPEEIIEEPQEQENLVLYEDGTIYAIFVHPLIINVDIAFDNDSHQDYMYDWFVTSGEFENALNELYKNNYILVKSTDLFEIDEAENKIIYKDIYLPEGKKPIVFSIDDMNYYKTMRNNGCAQYLYVDESGNLADKRKGVDEPDYGESIFILENFINEHPDFSFHGARGIIALTGYNGIFGHATHNLTDENFETEKEDALKVVNKLREMGWEFASHSYDHVHAAGCSVKEMTADCEQWKSEVESLIGTTNIYIYPFGELPKDSGQKVLEDFGFKFFLAVGKGTENQKNDNMFMISRRALDGVLLKYRSKNVFVDIDSVYSKPRK